MWNLFSAMLLSGTSIVVACFKGLIGC